MIRLLATLAIGLVVLPFFILAVLGTALIVTPIEALLGLRARRTASRSEPTRRSPKKRMRVA